MYDYVNLCFFLANLPSVLITSPLSPFSTLPSIVFSLHLSLGPLTSLLSVQQPARYLVSSSTTFTLTPPLRLSFVRPHLEYCSAIWEPTAQTLKRSLESVQLFALKLASKFHPQLIPSLQSHFSGLLSLLCQAHSTFEKCPLFTYEYNYMGVCICSDN